MDWVVGVVTGRRGRRIRVIGRQRRDIDVDLLANALVVLLERQAAERPPSGIDKQQVEDLDGTEQT